MTTVVDDKGFVNPPPPLEGQVFKGKVKDARGNMVTDKGANGAILAYREYKVKEEEKQRRKAEKIQRRAEKIAKCEELGPEDELDKEPSAILALLRLFLIIVVIALSLGWFITGSVFWDYDGKWVQLATYFPKNNKLFHELELARHDGTDPKYPIYVGIDGDVYDVSEGAHAYGPGGAYHNFAGVDAARAFATQCTNGHRTHDLRGLTERQLKSLAKWKKYFANKPKYPRVGRVLHMPIEPKEPIPGECGKEEKREPKFGPGVPAPVREGKAKVAKKKEQKGDL